MRYLKPGEYGVLNFVTDQGKGIIIFRAIRCHSEKPTPFEYGSLVSRGVLSASIDPDTVTDPVRFKISIHARDINDLFYFREADYLLHVELKLTPPVKVFKYFTSGSLQGTYNPILSAYTDTPFGFEWPPIEFIAIPNVHLDFAFRNPYKTEKVDPYIEWDYMWYEVKYPKDASLYEAVLSGKLKLPWFMIYGPEPFDYNFQTYMKTGRPIPIDATPDEIRSILGGWP